MIRIGRRRQGFQVMHLYMSVNISKIVYAKLENITSSTLRVHHRKMHDLKIVIKLL